MGKKNFTDGYDPFGAMIQRDEERLSAIKERAEAGAEAEVAADASPSPEQRPVEAPTAKRNAPPPSRPSSTLENDDEDEDDAVVRRRRPAVAERPVENAPTPKSRLPDRPRPAERPAPRQTVPSQNDFDRTEVSPRLKVTQAAFQDLETALANFHRATGSQIHYSIATRALWGLLIQAEAQVQEELKKHPLGRLPSTRDKLAYAEYEERVKQAFAQAFRKLPRTIFQPIGTVESEES